MFVVRMSTILNPAWRHVKVTPVCSRVSTRVSCFRRLFERLSSSPPPRCNRAHHVWRTYLAWTRTFEWISAFYTDASTTSLTKGDHFTDLLQCKRCADRHRWSHRRASQQLPNLKTDNGHGLKCNMTTRYTGDTAFVRLAFIAHRFRRALQLDLREFWEFLSEPVRLAKEFLQEESITCQWSQRLA